MDFENVEVQLYLYAYIQNVWEPIYLKGFFLFFYFEFLHIVLSPLFCFVISFGFTVV